MKKFLIIFCSLTLMATATLFAYNSDKAPSRQTEGINELPQLNSDRLQVRGKYLVEKMKYSEQDLKALAAYLNSR